MEASLAGWRFDDEDLRSSWAEPGDDDGQDGARMTSLRLERASIAVELSGPTVGVPRLPAYPRLWRLPETRPSWTWLSRGGLGGGRLGLAGRTQRTCWSTASRCRTRATMPSAPTPSPI